MWVNNFGVSLKSEKDTHHQVLTKIPAKLITARGRTMRSEIHKLISSVWKEEISEERKESIIVPMYRVIKKSLCT
jgi:hypothetical protein